MRRSARWSCASRHRRAALFADWHGYVGLRASSTYRLAIREVHLALVKAGIRDEVTLIASGGISLAEHVVKTLLCGADLVCIDVPLMIALECRLCMNCRKELACPVDIDAVEHGYAVQRMVNLMGAWHSQMLEMMGAMGIREAGRLRGEVGRAMFFDDLERDCFGPIFGKRREESAMTRKSRRESGVLMAIPSTHTEELDASVSRNGARRCPCARSSPRRTGSATRSASIGSGAARTCKKCGTCVATCSRGVHVRPEGYADFVRGLDWRCTAEQCKANGTYCVDKCPQRALRIEESPIYKSIGDYRWTADLILSTWHMAETGEVPDGELNYQTGNSGGGFDRIEFVFPEDGPRTRSRVRSTRRSRSIAAATTGRR